MMRLIILLLATVATAKPLFEEAPAFPPFAHNDGRPTMVANASHRTHYFSYDWLKGSRFADKYIRANYDVVPMTGKRGGGFIFDTNARKSTSTAWRSRAATI